MKLDSTDGPNLSSQTCKTLTMCKFPSSCLHGTSTPSPLQEGTQSGW